MFLGRALHVLRYALTANVDFLRQSGLYVMISDRDVFNRAAELVSTTLQKWTAEFKQFINVPFETLDQVSRMKVRF